VSLSGRLTLLLLVSLLLALLPLGVFTLREARTVALATLEDMALARLGLYRALSPGALPELVALAQEFGGYGFLVTEEGTSYTDTAVHDLPAPLLEALSAGAAYRGLYGRYLFVTLPLATPPTRASSANFVGLAILAEEVAALSRRLLVAYAVAAMLLIVVVGALGRWALAGILRPLRSLSRELATRSPDNLAPFAAPGLPELEPTVRRLNGLLARLGRALARSRAQERAARRFAAQASHELRTPLTALKGYLAVLERAPSEPRAHAGAARELARFERLLSALLTLARLESRSGVTPRPIDLAELARRSFPELALSGTAELWAEPELLELALHTLLDNARRHGAPPYRLWVERGGGYTRLRLEDGGEGFGAGVPDWAEEGRSGLGLSIVRAVMDVHGGGLELGRSPAGGAAVSLDFPLPERGDG
jgi:two-component system sensor histidine kinase TctE